jgi:hypothetical protein
MLDPYMRWTTYNIIHNSEITNVSQVSHRFNWTLSYWWAISCRPKEYINKMQRLTTQSVLLIKQTLSWFLPVHKHWSGPHILCNYHFLHSCNYQSQHVTSLYAGWIQPWFLKEWPEYSYFHPKWSHMLWSAYATQKKKHEKYSSCKGHALN